MKLAPQELRYTELVVNGGSDKEISRAMNITLNSVRSLAKRVRWKFKANNKTEVAVKAIREGFVSVCLIFCIFSSAAQVTVGDDGIEHDDPFRTRRGGRISQTVRILPTVRVMMRV